MANVTNDVKMFYIDDDISKIQTKTNLYIKQYGEAGASHLCREVIQNSIDEVIDKESPGSSILITYDRNTDTLTCEDDGRGFPEMDYPMDIFCTKIQSGSKFFRDQSGATAGEFGLGLTAVNALATTFSIESFREKEKYRHLIKFEHGKKVFDEKKKLTKNDKPHGCIVTFSPSAKYLGTGTRIPIDEVRTWIELMSYLIPTDMKMKIRLEIWKGLKLEATYKYKSRPFVELLGRLTDNPSYSPLMNFHCDTQWKEKGRALTLDKNGKAKNVEKTIQRYLSMEVALRYIPENITKYDSFCNFTNTTQGGIHQNTVEEVFCRTVIAAAKEVMTETQWEKYKPVWDDVRSGLCCVINLNTNAEVGFVGNVKEKIDNQKLIPILKEMLNGAMKKYFESNKSVLDAYVKIIRANAKARIDIQKVKEASQSEKMDALKEHSLPNFIPCNNSRKGQFRELFIVEGQSGAGSASSSCDRDTQAFYLLRGVTKNAFKVDFSTLMENKEWRGLRDVLRGGIGDSLDLDKIWYQRINIMTDSDIDGYYITLGILAFLYRYMRPLIEAGRVYKVMAPLYRIDDKNHPFVIRRTEITDIFFSKVVKKFKIDLLKQAGFGKRDEPLSELKNQDLYTFLDDLRDYLKFLGNCADVSGKLDMRFVELVLSLLTIVGGMTSSTTSEQIKQIVSDQRFIKEFLSKMQRFYPETTMENGLIRSTVNGHYVVLKINTDLIRNGRRLLPIYEKYGYRVQLIEKGKEPKVLALSDLMKRLLVYKPNIEARFKGLGELDAEEIWETVLDINNRISIQYTTKDIAQEIETFQKLMGQGSSDKRLRKQMMEHYHIDREDLDN